ncbi:glycoside hydrolase [Dipodascopsis uninucleata]
MVSELVDIGDSKQLYVNGKPFLVLGAELHNSSASTIDWLRPILPKLVDYNINTVFLPISWEVIEPEEDVFDFTLLDDIIAGCREHKLHIGLLWFGSFKNGESGYIPAWMKKQPDRFPRSKTMKDGKLMVTKTLSVFEEVNVQADIKAFKRLMLHLKEADFDSTVVMVQVQNESGVLWDSRDRSEVANKHYRQPVPAQLMSYLKSNKLAKQFTTKFSVLGEFGSWAEVFGDSEFTEEIFMCWNYACYIEKVAAAGKEVYSIPLFINAALNIPDSAPVKIHKRPGQYPSGGVLPHSMDIYRAAGTNIDIYSPDIYADEFEEFCDAYRHNGNPLLIPETRRDYYSAERMFYAYGTCKAIGVSPFGIDSVWEESVLFKSHYSILKQVSSYVLEAQKNDNIFGFHFRDDVKVSSPIEHKFGKITAHIDRSHSYGKNQSGFGMIMRTNADEFLGVGFGFNVSFSTDSGRRIEILSIHEGHFLDEGKFKETRRLNGDETASMSRWNFAVVNPDYGDYHVPICYPATTAISFCKIFEHESIYGRFP